MGAISLDAARVNGLIAEVGRYDAGLATRLRNDVNQGKDLTTVFGEASAALRRFTGTDSSGALARSARIFGSSRPSFDPEGMALIERVRSGGSEDRGSDFTLVSGMMS